jgi:uncharacterized protein YlzI (FlbEa/FlbD family)
LNLEFVFLSTKLKRFRVQETLENIKVEAGTESIPNRIIQSRKKINCFWKEQVQTWKR